MIKPLAAAALLLMFLCAPPLSQAASIYGETDKLIRAGRSVQALGPDLFGDKVNLYTGAVEFVQTDVSLPGNSELPVRVGRRLVPGTEVRVPGLFGDWDLDIPHLYGVFSSSRGWSTQSGGGRCSAYGAPPQVVGSSGSGGTFNPDEYWHGSFMYLPGSGAEEILLRNSGNGNVPSDGNAWPLVTHSLASLRCLPAPLAAGGGEGFLAITPDGTQYRFDQLVARPYQVLVKGSPAPDLLSTRANTAAAAKFSGSKLATAASGGMATPNVAEGYLLKRQEFWILPTQVSDRHGNTVTYKYDTARPWRLLSIEASDGRRIALTYVTATDDRVATVSDGTRTWSYSYDGNTDIAALQRVTQPDGSAWQFSMGQFTQVAPFSGGEDCELPQGGRDDVTGSMTHPSGAVGTFLTRSTWHGRSFVERQCSYNTAEGYSRVIFPRFFNTQALQTKTLSGPGLPTQTWSYAYSAAAASSSWSTCTGTCPDTKTVEVTDPRNMLTRHTFGNRFRVSEGQLLKVEVGPVGGAVLRTTATRYRDPGAGPYPSVLGSSPQRRTAGDLAQRLAPADQRVVTQQGTSFTWQASAFDTYARPTAVTRSSSLGTSRGETTVYHDHTAKWILGQVRSITDSAGQVMVLNEYDPDNANLLSTSRFGRLEQRNTYHPDGTLWTRSDGLNQTTTFSDYKRGLARLARYADGSSESAVVNDIGLIDSVTDPNNHTTYYSYDAMGRLGRITYPGADTVAWADTTLRFEPVGSDEYGLGAGHWRQTIATGNGLTVNYFDALWRPRLTRTWDAGNEAGTASTVLRHFDADNRTTFESYPQRSIAGIGSAATGISTTYDALGRVTQTRADSELGVLTTSVEYLDGFLTRSTNPRNFASTQSFWALDNPDEALLAGLSAPEGVSLGISRDLYGKPLAITRGGNYGGQAVSVTRSYVYDANQRLCKTVEPEAGATVQAYDAANNVAWRAPGQNLPGTASCDQGSVPESAKIGYSYSAVNQLTGTSYGDGSPGITRSYTPDGLPETVASNGSLWSYSYNKRRLLEQEVLGYGGVNYAIGWGYDANGHRSRIRYPDGAGLDYAPNALGQAGQAGGYASGVSYHPNGAMAGYTLGNGIVHSRTQNTRGLPLQNRDAGVLQDLYGYDANGNVAAITDQQEGVFNRAMGYDGLDRLSSANAPNVWGAASYAYDPVDNLRVANVGSRSSTLGYDSSNRLSSVVTNGVATGYGYDANGNIRVKGAQSFGFDIGNRLTSASLGGSYTYDGHGRRIRIVSTDGSTRIQVYSQGGQLIWASSSGGPRPAGSTAYVYLGKQQIAETSTASGTQYVHTDALGSPVAHTNTAGQILNRTRYEPYGFTAQGTKPGPDSSVIGFTGHVNDPETDLVYMQQRYYDPIAGRFLSVDPVVTDAKTGKGFGRYHYGSNNPYRYVDPDGRIVETPWDAANVAMGFVSFTVNMASGNFVGAAVDAIGIAIDATATAVPGMPGGAATAINAARMAERATEAAATLTRAGERVSVAVEKTASGKRVGDFTKSQRDAAKAENAATNGGTMACTDCAKPVESIANKTGVPTPANQAQVHHDPALKNGGGRDSKAVVLCPKCHQERHDAEK